jgi:cell division protein FtsI/penicillin-binding protein 2
MRHLWVRLFGLTIALLVIAHFVKTERDLINKAFLAKTVGQSVAAREFPREVQVNIPDLKSTQLNAKIQYTIDFDLQQKMQDLFAQYRPDYGAFVAVNANTGRVIVMVDTIKNGDPTLGHLALQARFPAASVFKTVTAAAAIDQRLLTADTVIPFNGASNTLYRRNVRDTKVNRWTRFMPLKDAFAHSVNTVFGKVGAFFLGRENLLGYAERFGFNREIPSDLPLTMSMTRIDESEPWSLVEAASGFTLQTTMSPLQGALIASSVVNHGSIMEPCSSAVWAGDESARSETICPFGPTRFPK